MNEEKNKQNKEFKDVNDDIEKMHYIFNWGDKKINDYLKKKIQEYKEITNIIYFSITFGFILFFILMLFNVFYLFLVSNMIINIICILYAIFLRYDYLKKIQYFYLIIGKNKISKGKIRNNTNLQILFYSFIALVIIIILILSMIGINPLILVISITIALIYIYIDKDV